ncbi:hypothetical protein E3T54_05495 [Cryobacterium sp. Sr8]|uniref:hypothetical protein n=1 Tax=Cryobacterium sp. Sr8 TaxID=1259203 RepID=UPI00106CC6AB|nr:hypothetical protein [Cryobacterium sp. Sr8]TFD79132.1 hypothetical protein E3T54_05495 [Cryobacterium sp. Sr8]
MDIVPAAAEGRWRLSWSIFIAFAVATLVLGVGRFEYDAAAYWSGAQAVAGTAPPVAEGFWDFRGILSSIVYVPAALVAGILGPTFEGFSVLLQNSLFFAWFAAFLLPKCIEFWRPVSTRTVALGAFLTWVVLSGFAPYALVDAYPAIAAIAIVVLFRLESRAALFAAGVLGGMSVNIRPAYIVGIVGLAAVALVLRRWVGILFALGVFVGLMPQLILNVVRIGSWTLWPTASSSLVSLQAGFAAYIVRYDTFLGAANPRQFYCSPDMASQLVTPLPATAGELAATFGTHMPSSIVFALQKIGAALHWPYTTPYTVPSAGLDGFFATSITAITVLGIAYLIYSAIHTRGHVGSIGARAHWAALATMVIGGVIMLVASATESRFALPLVLIGVVGSANFADLHLREAWGRRPLWVVFSVLAVFAVGFVGVTGLQNPAPPGAVDQGVCASLQAPHPG